MIDAQISSKPIIEPKPNLTGRNQADLGYSFQKTDKIGSILIFAQSQSEQTVQTASLEDNLVLKYYKGTIKNLGEIIINSIINNFTTSNA